MRKLSLSLFAVAIAAAAFVGSGCSSAAADPLVGTWTSELNQSGMTGTAETVYGADKSFSSVMTMKSPMGALNVNQKGKWAYEDGKKVKITLESADFNLTGGDEASKKSFNDSFNTPAAKAEMIKKANESPATEIVWKGNDEFSTSLQGQSMVFKRKK